MIMSNKNIWQGRIILLNTKVYEQLPVQEIKIETKKEKDGKSKLGKKQKRGQEEFWNE